MNRRHLAIAVVMLGLNAALAGCDDAGISRIERRVFFDAKDIAKLPKVGGLPVEVHGLPWPGAMPDEIASTLRMPIGIAQDARFRAISPGQWVVGDGERLVLHFNPAGEPNHVADCRAKEEFQTKPPAKRGFTVNATYCKGSEWLIHAFLEADDVAADDWYGYTIVMRKLLGTLFPED